MASKEKPQTIVAAIDRIAEELGGVISAEVERRVGALRAELLREQAAQLAAARKGAKAAAKAGPAARGGRVAPQGKKGAAKRPAPKAPPAKAAKPAAGKAARASAPKAAAPSKAGAPLDMRCRVEGCNNRSRGPRLGFICDAHRAVLSPAAQLRAREAYKARQKSGAIAAPSPRPSAPPAVPAPKPAAPPAPAHKPPAVHAPAPHAPAPHAPAPKAAASAPREAAPAPVAPHVEPAPAPESPAASGPGPAEVGAGYLLTIERARLIDLKKLGPTVELKFAVADGPQSGRIARGQFPVSGRGLPVLTAAALGQQLDLADADTLERLVGKRVRADVVHSGNPDGILAIVRNIRPPASP